MFDHELLGSIAAHTAAPKDLFICFSHLRWDFVFQRPQHLLTRAAKEFQVVFFEEPVFEGTRKPLLRRRMTPAGVEVATPVLPIGVGEEEANTVLREMLDLILVPADRQALIFWYYTPLALSYSAHVPPDLCVYDCMDELSLFREAPHKLSELEAQLLQRADLVFTGGASLYKVKRERHSAVTAFPSSVDVSHFAQARASKRSDPQDQQHIARPRIGFFGVIDERMDLGLVQSIAALRPEYAFVMIGPVVKIDPGDLPRAQNLHWLGQKAYEQLPDYLAHWDCAMMPFARNESTRFISPTKTPEFLAAGKRVVSTSIADVIDPYGVEGLVEIADPPEMFVDALDRMLRAPDRLWLARVDRRLSQMSWDRTWSAMRAQLTLTLTRLDVKRAVGA